MYKNLGQDQGFEHDTVPSQYPLPEELRHSSFKPYLENLKKLIPIIATILLIFTSKTYDIKLHAKATNPKWILWSYFYRSWIIDTFLRARAPKSIRRTTMLVSTYMLLGNIFEPCWRLLQRLKIVVAKDTVEKWVKQHTKELKSTETVLWFVFDNCNFHLNATNRTHNHKSSYLNIITQFIVEIPLIPKVLACNL